VACRYWYIFWLFSALSGGAFWLTAKEGWATLSETQKVKTGIFGGLGFLGNFCGFYMAAVARKGC
jgi:hypothetical protein